jgi:V8-like Glu-specific endopeptidase
MNHVAVLLALICLLPTSARAQQEPAIGRLNLAGHHTTEMCTASLITPSQILTAAHCVTRPEDGYLKRQGDMVFVAGWDGKAHSGAARIREVHVHPRAYETGRFDLRHDLAVVDLAEPLDIPTLRIGATTSPGPLTLMGYQRSRPHRLSITPYCYGMPEGDLWRIGCRVEPGQSGGPVFYGEGSARRIVAVIVAVSEEQAIAVPVDAWLRQQFAATR